MIDVFRTRSNNRELCCLRVASIRALWTVVLGHMSPQDFGDTIAYLKCTSGWTSGWRTIERCFNQTLSPEVCSKKIVCNIMRLST